MRSPRLARATLNHGDGLSPEAYGPISGLLRHLFQVIGRPDAGGHRLDRWEDDAYYYLELALPDLPERDADIFVHDGKVLIRVER